MDHPYEHYTKSDRQLVEALEAENARLRSALMECADAYDIADVMEAIDNARKVLYGR